MKPEYVLKRDNVRKLVKSLAVLESIGLAKLKMLINEKYNKTDTPENLTNKLRTGTIRVFELIEIFDILGYDIIIKKK